jgi:predicted HAD superfamily Cof-like phosphohydrolase
MNPFRDQEKFMKACSQSTDTFNADQFNMYIGLIEEEAGELAEAIAAHDQVETLDALIDILIVTIGAIHSAGYDAEGAWKEVMRSNFSKVGEDGKVRKREDGKVLKPIGFSPPDLKSFVIRSN